MPNASPSSLPIIALTQGDPAGIGPEICLKAAASPDVLTFCRPAIIGDRAVLGQAAERLGLPLPSIWMSSAEALRPGMLERIHEPVMVDCGALTGPIEPGRPTQENGEASYRYITTAIQGALTGIFAAITTAPITKTTLHMAGIEEPGHTEILARLTGTEDYAMMFHSPRLVVTLVTIHQSLDSVASALTVERVRRTTALTGRALRGLLGREPHLAVLGFNPHAGEQGMFGDEEACIIAPAIELLKKEGWNVDGPVVPDAAFMPHMIGRYDAHIAMYHDQGLIPFKMISLADGVNVTLGLPIVRTSVDHGTAYDIAWQGKADESSLIAAIRLATSLARAK